MPDFKQHRRTGARPHNLPIQLTSFVGREQELAQVRQLLGKTRLLTLTGTGGVGKTRLCLEVAGLMLDGFKDGVWLVKLGSLFEPQLVVQKIILRILVTSREPLGVPGETIHQVPPLSLPDLDQPVDLDDLIGSEAFQLFIERVQEFKPDFKVESVIVPAIIQICSQLDGIPLAIELAAARVRVLSLPQIAARLDDSLRLLTRGSRMAVPRQQTLQATIDWSYALLTKPEQILF